MRSLKLRIIFSIALLATTLSSVFSRTIDSADINEEKRNLGDGQATLKRIKKQIDVSNGKYTDAAYAGKFAFMLKDLESQNKDVYTNFISSGFAGENIPRELPPQIRSLSRIPSQPKLSASNNFLSTNSIQSSFPTGERVNALNEVQLLNSRESQLTQRQNSQLPSFLPSQFPSRQFPQSQFPSRQFPQSQFPSRQFPQRQGPLLQVPQNRGLQRQVFRRPDPFRRLRL